jgi:hypothetical protein
MDRSALDRLTSGIGAVLGVVLLAAGGLLTWGSGFALGQVEEQLVSQKVTMPAEDSDSFKALPAADQDALRPYSGQEMTSGDQAYAYANHYIKVHMAGVADGKVYEEVSGEFMAANAKLKANPTDTALAAEVAKLGGQRTTLFMGSTLVGLLGYAYAFATIGKIALFASYAAYGAGIVLLVLSFLGFRHARKVTA